MELPQSLVRREYPGSNDLLKLIQLGRATARMWKQADPT